MSSRFNNSLVYNQLNTWLQRVQRTGNDKFADVQSRQHLNISHIDGELEIRLGKFDNERYIGGLHNSDWESICNVFSPDYHKSETSIRIYYPKNFYTEHPLDNDNLPPGFNTQPLHSIIYSHPQKYKNNILIEKIGVARRDFTDLGMRAAYKLEVYHNINAASNHNHNRGYSISKLGPVTNERHRTRNVYKLGDYYELHMTKTISFQSKYNPNTKKHTPLPPTITYEAEIELMPNVDLLRSSTDILSILTRELISYLYIIEQIYTIRINVTQYLPYRQLRIEQNGLMNKPADLSVNDLPSIVERYTATDKADGIRMFLIIDNDGRLIMTTGTGVITPIRRLGSGSGSRSRSKSNNGSKSNTSSIGDMFDGMLDYIYDAIGTLGNTTSNASKTPSNNNIKNTSGYNYLDTSIPMQLISDDEWYDAIFDCEYLVDGRGRPRLYIFDCISCGNGQRTYLDNLLVRLACVNRFTLYMANTNHGSNGLTTDIAAKHFYLEHKHLTPRELDIVRHLDNVTTVDNFSHAVCKLWQSRRDSFWYDLDGIIFTPLDGPYLVERNSTSPRLPLKIYKWKDEQTIDVRIHLSNDRKKWLFYTGQSNERLIDDWRNYSYTPAIGLGAKGLASVASNMKDGDIIEMIWDNTVRQFVPYRNRTGDKDWPNSPITIAGIIKLVQRPVGIEDLVRYLADGTPHTVNINSTSTTTSNSTNLDKKGKKGRQYKNDKKDSKGKTHKANSKASIKDRSAMEFGKLYYQEVEQLSTRKKAIDKNMRDFHNYVKANLIHRISTTSPRSNTPSTTPATTTNNNTITTTNNTKPVTNSKIAGLKMLLDLSVGKAGDLKKWIAADVDVVVGIDISGTAITEARRRYQALPYDDRRHLDVYFINGDSTQDITASGNMCLDSTSRQEWQRFCNRYGIGDNDADLQIFDMVVSNFAIHYIVETTEQRRTLCHNLARFLVPGGIFVGTLLDADIIRQEMAKRKTSTIEAKTDTGNVFYRIDGVIPDGGSSNNVKKIIVSRTGWANPIPEPALSADEFRAILRKCSDIKWDSVNLDTFQSLYNKRGRAGRQLSRGEQYISFMHKTFVATRK